MTQHDDILALVIDKIRTTINEDWILDYEIGMDTQFNEDLEIESIEFVKIANAIQQHYGQGLNIAAWLSGKTINELIGLNVGTLVDYIASHVKA
ncbi:MAG: acyl carrier protein [Limnobacter sp.]|uniref:acyl carrier protein n=1 Tax=Limnobacter sp. TaxID=2003368 RepID=UPI00391D5EED